MIIKLVLYSPDLSLREKQMSERIGFSVPADTQLVISGTKVRKLKDRLGLG